MPDWIIYAIGGIAALLMLGRPAVMAFFPNSGFACWLEETFPESFGNDGDCGDGDGGGD